MSTSRDRAIFLNEVKLVCEDFGFNQVKFKVENIHGSPDNFYILNRPENPNIKENCENFLKLVDYMDDFSKKHNLKHIMDDSYFSMR